MPRVKEKYGDVTTENVTEFREALIEVGMKLCDDLMKGKARNEDTALKAIVEIYGAVNGNAD